MKALVFIEPNKVDAEPFTTSKVVSEVTDVGHKKIKAAITKHRAALETFGKVVSYGDTLESGQTEILYRLSEPQATLLITFLKNTPAVVAFKTELVRQFYLMRRRMQEWRIVRERSKAAHRSLTDAVRDNGGSTWTYKHLTDLAYKRVTGQTAKQLRANRGACKGDTAKDFLTPDELTAIEKLDSLIAALLDAGMEYHGIKAMLLQMDTLRIAS